MCALGARRLYAQGGKRLAFLWLPAYDMFTRGALPFSRKAGQRQAGETRLGRMKSFSEGKHFGGQAQARLSKEFEEKDVADGFFGKDR